ncbi:MFS transporter [Corynebacterium doosanense]|uniref:MFS transporter n=1 Tax=Corynebacterium doosanense CAU 212 = DSM 45436 TaxID=558173 RepID=A0A097IHS2_9CORY|nr:aromatic acid/H+ symport family MFS transporter [Corynebacterium doosanense]AIT61671.1 MFS transporter [Corynebacterium doosanense CAU 212 = DSM 45436]
MSTSTSPATRSSLIVTLLCWFAILLDGFDLVVLGVTIPSMLEDEGWSFSPADATFVSTVGLFGMMVGALTIGTLTDRLGRRRILIWSVALFSLFTLGLAFTENVMVFGLLRFLAGAGLGGALPTAISLVTEFRGAKKGGSASTLLMTGYHTGAVATALLGMYLIQPLGWHAMFIAGALPAILLIPAMLLWLPESPQYLHAKGDTARAERIAADYGLSLESDIDRAHKDEVESANSVSALFKPTFRRNTIIIWVTSFMGLLLVYGTNTWLPQIMRGAGYNLGSSLSFLLVLNLGAVIGLLVAGRIADRISPRTTALFWFFGAAVLLGLLSIKMPVGALYVVLFLTGVFVFSAQVLIYGFVGENYPSKVRATALGFSAGIGRLGAISGPLLGGVLVSYGVAYPWGFYAFAVVALIGALVFTGSKTLNRH